MEITKFGQTIDCAKDPIDGALLCLSASKGCASKRSAWEWAEQAIYVLEKFRTEKIANELKAILGNENFPNSLNGIEFLEKFKSEFNKRH